MTRNRVRRRLQAVIASVTTDLGAGTYLVGAGPAAAATTYAELASGLVTALVALPQPGGLVAPPQVVATGVA